MNDIEKIIDVYLDALVCDKQNKLPLPIVPAMADAKQDNEEEWRIWYPIKSAVTDKELKRFESSIGCTLPESYKQFLKYKHFYELQIGACTFCEHPAGVWETSLSAMIFDESSKEQVFDKGKIPFATWEDWALLCFDTTAKNDREEYAIVLWDPEACDCFEFVYDSLEDMMISLHEEQTEL